jgi:hypothetical protein
MVRESIGIVVIASWLVACGGNSPSQPSPATAPVPVPTMPLVLRDALALEMRTPSASFVINAGGGPGLVHYQFGIFIKAVDWPSVDVTIQRVEQWALGADGSEYGHRLEETPTRIGVSSGQIGTNRILSVLDHEFTARPVARTYRARVEYRYDGGLPAGVFALTAEQEIVSNIPSPLMTSVEMTGDAPLWPTSFPLRPITLVAAGTGGITPYAYRFQVSGTTLREWSTDPKFIWDPNQTLPEGAVRVRVYARSAGRTDPEVLKWLDFSIKK